MHLIHFLYLLKFLIKVVLIHVTFFWLVKFLFILFRNQCLLFTILEVIFELWERSQLCLSFFLLGLFLLNGFLWDLILFLLESLHKFFVHGERFQLIQCLSIEVFCVMHDLLPNLIKAKIIKHYLFAAF
jgi:hypothetical protein